MKVSQSMPRIPIIQRVRSIPEIRARIRNKEFAVILITWNKDVRTPILRANILHRIDVLHKTLNDDYPIYEICVKTKQVWEDIKHNIRSRLPNHPADEIGFPCICGLTRGQWIDTAEWILLGINYKPLWEHLDTWIAKLPWQTFQVTDTTDPENVHRLRKWRLEKKGKRSDIRRRTVTYGDPSVIWKDGVPQPDAIETAITEEANALPLQVKKWHFPWMRRRQSPYALFIDPVEWRVRFLGMLNAVEKHDQHVSVLTKTPFGDATYTTTCHRDPSKAWLIETGHLPKFKWVVGVKIRAKDEPNVSKAFLFDVIDGFPNLKPTIPLISQEGDV